MTVLFIIIIGLTEGTEGTEYLKEDLKDLLFPVAIGVIITILFDFIIYQAMI